MDTSRNLFDLTGKTALVTGANRGIGAGIALALARAGADIIGVSRTEPPRQHPVPVEIHRLGRTFRAFAHDLSQPREVTSLLEAVASLDHPIDILVNNAGIALRAPVEDHSHEQWNEVLDVNLTVPFVLARGIGTTMLQRGSGKIIFLASMLSYQGGTDVVSYAASKSGIVGIVHAMANEWAGRGVNVNAIAPGYISTDLTRGSHADPDRSHAFESRIPASRWGTPDDVGGAAVFLASDAASYIHGVVLPVDGGWLVR